MPDVVLLLLQNWRLLQEGVAVHTQMLSVAR